MRRLLLTLTVIALGLAGCGGEAGSGGDRTVIVDYNHDEFAAFYMGNFPTNVKVHPGDTIVFRQEWTGEPHTVTMGQNAQDLGEVVGPYFDGSQPIPEDEPPAAMQAAQDVPQFFDFESDDLALVQTGAQPCYLETGPLPADGKPCPKVDQPAFNGRQAIYNSGFIPYEGNNGNRFEVELSEDIAADKYFYFCLIHGAPMGGFIEVVPESEELPSQSEVNRAARSQIDKVTKRLEAAHRKALRGEGKEPGVDVVSGADAEGLEFPFAATEEFYPKRFRAKVGDTVTWAVNGHTVSFNVPEYGPQIIVEDDGTVKFNPQAYEPVNAPEAPEPFGEEEGPPPVQDAGTYVSDKYISSGVSGALFKLKFTKAGTYKYACVIHPRMIAEVVVS